MKRNFDEVDNAVLVKQVMQGESSGTQEIRHTWNWNSFARVQCHPPPRAKFLFLSIEYPQTFICWTEDLFMSDHQEGFELVLNLARTQNETDYQMKPGAVAVDGGSLGLTMKPPCNFRSIGAETKRASTIISGELHVLYFFRRIEMTTPFWCSLLVKLLRFN